MMTLNPCRDIGKPCTLCCRIMGVDELKKPRHQWCHACDKYKGCTIYSARPQSCEAYSCGWAISQSDPKLPALSIELKPSVCGALINTTKDGKELVIDLNDGIDPREGMLGEFILQVSKTPMRVFIRQRAWLRVVYDGRVVADFTDDALMTATDVAEITIPGEAA